MRVIENLEKEKRAVGRQEREASRASLLRRVIERKVVDGARKLRCRNDEDGVNMKDC